MGTGKASRFVAGIALILAVVLMIAAPVVRADSVAVTLDNTTADTLANPPFTLGYQFAVNTPITVTRLGVFDDSLNGLADSHQVGLWDAASTLLASTTIASGTANPLINQFRYQSIAPVALGVGVYRIGALYLTGNDNMVFPGNAINFATDPAITFLNNAFNSNGTLSDPIFSGGTDPAYFGPNFTFNGANVVPLPKAAWGGLALIAALALQAVTNRRWQRVA